MDPLPIPDPLQADLQAFLGAINDQRQAQQDNDHAQQLAADAAGTLRTANDALAAARSVLLSDIDSLAPAPPPPAAPLFRNIHQRR